MILDFFKQICILVYITHMTDNLINKNQRIIYKNILIRSWQFFFLNMVFFYSIQCITFENIIPENETSIEAVELCKLILGDLIRRFCK